MLQTLFRISVLIVGFFLVVPLYAQALDDGSWESDSWDYTDGGDIEPTQEELDAELIRQERLIAFSEAFNDECPIRITDNLFIESVVASSDNVLDLTYKVMVDQVPELDQARKDLFRAALTAGLCNNRIIYGIFRYADEMNVTFLDFSDRPLGTLLIQHSSCQTMKNNTNYVPETVSNAQYVSATEQMAIEDAVEKHSQ